MACSGQTAGFMLDPAKKQIFASPLPPSLTERGRQF